MWTLLLAALRSNLPWQDPPNPVAVWQAEREIAKGDGRTVVAGDIVTFEFTARLVSGKKLADSVKRGLAYTLVADPKGQPFAAALVGMHETGEREVRLTYAQPGVQGIVPGGEPILVWLKVDSIQAGATR